MELQVRPLSALRFITIVMGPTTHKNTKKYFEPDIVKMKAETSCRMQLQVLCRYDGEIWSVLHSR